GDRGPIANAPGSAGRIVWALFVCLTLASSLRADEALRTDGQRVPGKLTLDVQHRPRFLPADRTASLPPTDLTAIRFPDAGPPSPFRTGAGHRVRLQDGQVLTGQLLHLNKEALSLRTAWSEKIELPRSAVAALTQLPGWHTLIEDDFSAGVAAWTVTGTPRVEGGDKKPRRVLLDNGGQSLRWKPPTPITAGRVGVVFEEMNRPAGARWLLEMSFQGQGEAVTLRTTLAGDRYEVEVAGLPGAARRVPRTPGPHLLLVQFKATSLRVTCDDDVLWYNLDRGPGGALQQVSLRCQEAGRPAELRGAVAISEFTLARAVDESPRPPGDPRQEEVWLASDDQLFGQILRADRQLVEITGRYGSRVFAWSELRGCFFKQEKAPSRPVGEVAVRLAIHSGLTPEPDVLTGILTSVEDKKLTLRHTLLGELVIEKSRVKALRFLAAKE
ncbi:MAG TPA: hypothetical protein VFA18_20465, partial [Gemmataceae bacterium]|nr:hypothetical protein [Gemmataceae bacterium]